MKNYRRMGLGCLVLSGALSAVAGEKQPASILDNLELDEANQGKVFGGFIQWPAPAVWVNNNPEIANLDLNRVRLGDFNGDGQVDIYRIEGWNSTQPGQIWLNQENGNFTHIDAPAVWVNSNPQNGEIDLARIQLGDFNGDGKTDIYRIEGWSTTELGQIWLSNGDGTYQHRDGPPVWVNGELWSSGDWVWVSHFFRGFHRKLSFCGTNLWVYGNDFHLAHIDLSRIQLGDFNGDGLTDIYRIEGWNNAPAGQIWLSQRDGSYVHMDGPALWVSSSPPVAAIDLARVQLADFNGDGLTDIYRINGNNSVENGAIFLSQPGGGFKSITAPAVWVNAVPEVAHLDLSRIRLGDFNGDGLTDIYRIEGWNTTEVGNIWLNQADGRYVRIDAPAVWVNSNPDNGEIDLARIQLADFNGDGLTDIYRVEGWSTTQTGQIWISHGDGKYDHVDAPPFWVNGDLNIAQIDLSRVKLADFNGDGLADIYHINGWNTTEVGAILLSRGME